MEIVDTEFEEVKIIIPEQIIDSRGYREIAYSQKKYNDFGIFFELKEERIYRIKKDAFFGIHFQNNPLCQNKMIMLINGKGHDFIVDLRENSKTYKKWFKIELNSKNNQILYVPHGFGHAFLSLTDDVIMSFRIDQYFDNNLSKSINYKDPEINLNIQINEDLISEQDKYAPFLKNSSCNL